MLSNPVVLFFFCGVDFFLFLRSEGVLVLELPLEFNVVLDPDMFDCALEVLNVLPFDSLSAESDFDFLSFVALIF